MEKDQEIIKHHKQKMIEEIKSYDRSKMVSPKPQKKLSFFKKILIVLGHGKKG
jgi:hypothetical protein